MNMNISNIILTTGGTGGHIFPAIAVAEEIRKRNPRANILFLGSKYGVEADLLAKAGYRFAGLPVKGIMGKGIRSIGNCLAMFRSVTSAIFLMRRLKPQVVLGFGGYAAFASTYAAAFCGLPSAIHEQNAFPGMANKVLGKKVDKVFLSMPDTARFFPAHKIIDTGNPVRKDISHLAEIFEERRAEKAKQPTKRLLVLGGSQGATAINKGMTAIIQKLSENNVEVWHQTGKSDYEQVRAAYRDAGIEHIRVEAFITDMAQAYAWADLTVCRAGASTLAEVAAAGLPSVLVPFPHAAQDHQTHNAKGIAATGAALVMEQTLFAGDNAGKLFEAIINLYAEPDRLESMAQAANALAKPFAAACIVDELEKLVKNYKQ